MENAATQVQLKQKRETSPSVRSPQSFLALLIAIAAFICVLVFYLNFKNDVANLMEDNNVLTSQVKQAQAQVQDIVQLAKTQATQQQADMMDMQKLGLGDMTAWKFAEARYLTKLAFYHLNFTRDAVSALALLQAANERITAINDPNLMQLRQLLANNIAALDAIQKVDLSAVLVKISALQTQALNLPSVGFSPTKNAIQENDEAGNSLSSMQRAFRDTLVTLQKIVVIRHKDEAVYPLLTPEQQTYLQQNLQLILQQAQWAAIRGQGNVYLGSLEQAKSWVLRFFAPNMPATQAFLKAIADLEKVQVQPPLPNLAPLVQAFQQVNLSTVKQG